MYGKDLRVLVRDESPRRVGALVLGLPPDSLVWNDDAANAATPAPRAQNVVSIADFAARHKEQQHVS